MDPILIIFWSKILLITLIIIFFYNNYLVDNYIQYGESISQQSKPRGAANDQQIRKQELQNLRNSDIKKLKQIANDLALFN